MNRELTELKSLRILPTPEAMGRVRPAIKTQTTQSNWKMNRVNLNRTRSIRQILPATLIALYLCMSCAPEAFGAGEELLPPFGFRWNDSMAHVEAVLHGAKAKIISREKKENREIWIVEGLVHPGLKRTLFTFKERSLIEVELQYEYPDRTIEWYNQRMGEIRKYFDEKWRDDAGTVLFFGPEGRACLPHD